MRWAAASLSARSVPLGAFASLMTAGRGADAVRTLQDAARELRGDGPAVLVVDDAHLLDDTSATVVHQLALSRAVSLLVTVRAGHGTSDAVTALWKDGLLDRVDLAALTTRDTLTLLETVLDGPVEDASALRMWDVTGGNPLYIRQLVEGALESGSLRRSAGVWQWRGRIAVTPRLGELLLRRIGDLPVAIRRVVEVVAYGEPLAPAVLARLAEPAAIDEAERRALIRAGTPTDPASVRLAHPLFGEAVRARTGPLAARRLRTELVTALTAAGRQSPADRLKAAVLSLDADAPVTAERLVEASWQATSLSNLALGERLARAAVAVGDAFEAPLALGYALSWQGDGGGAHEVLAPLLGRATTDVDRARVAVPTAANLYWTLHRPADAAAVVDGVLAGARDAAEHGELLALAACFAFFSNRLSAAGAMASEVLDLPGQSDRAVTWGACALCPVLAVTGRGDDVAEVAARGYAAASRTGETSLLASSIGLGEVLAHVLTGRLDTAEQTVRRLVAAAGGQSLAGAVATLVDGRVALARGAVHTARRRLQDAVAAFASGDPADFGFLARLWLIDSLAVLGEGEAARALLLEAQSMFRSSIGFFEPDLYLARAWVAAAEGAPGRAARSALRAADVCAASGQLAMEVVALHHAARFGDRGSAQRTERVAARVDGDYAPAASAHVTALARDDGAGLERASLKLQHIGATLAAADASAQAALAHRRAGHRRGELAAAERAARLAALCEGARTPALVSGTQSLPLTGREREVATLAAAGLSNRDIAERLVISVRTVEGHVYRACAKLDLNDRAELSSVLAPEIG